MRKLDVLVIAAVAITFIGMLAAALVFTWLNAQGRPKTEQPMVTVDAEQVRSAGGVWCDADLALCIGEVEPGRFFALDAVKRHSVFGKRGCQVECVPPSDALMESFGEAAAGGLLREPCGGASCNLLGTRGFGPAESDLYRYPTTAEGARIVVDLSRRCQGEDCS